MTATESEREAGEPVLVLVGNPRRAWRKRSVWADPQLGQGLKDGGGAMWEQAHCRPARGRRGAMTYTLRPERAGVSRLRPVPASA